MLEDDPARDYGSTHGNAPIASSVTIQKPKQSMPVTPMRPPGMPVTPMRLKISWAVCIYKEYPVHVNCMYGVNKPRKARLNSLTKSERTQMLAPAWKSVEFKWNCGGGKVVRDRTVLLEVFEWHCKHDNINRWDYRSRLNVFLFQLPKLTTSLWWLSLCFISSACHIDGYFIIRGELHKT